VLVSTLAVAGLVAGYVAYSAKLQAAAKESENFAYQQRKQKDAGDSARKAVEAFANAVKTMSDDSLSRNINVINSEIAKLEKILRNIQTRSNVHNHSITVRHTPSIHPCK
jgi:ABC-type transporter Mla subunit MlaD